MDEKENLVTEQVTENVEQPTEQTPKTFTQQEVDLMVKEKLDQVLPGKIARAEARIRKENDRNYGELMGLLRAGTGKETVEDIADSMREFYGSKGIKTPEEPKYSQKDIEVLARAEADDIIRAGFEEVVEETDRLSKVDADKMTPREKAVFMALAAHRQSEERRIELTQLGVTPEVYNSEEFKSFASKFSPSTPIADVYSIYEKTQPKKEIQTMGSMTNTDSGDGGVKDFYTFEEASKFTRKDFERNPALLKAVEQSMAKWK